MLNSAEVLRRHEIKIPERPKIELSNEIKILDDLESINKKKEHLIENGEIFFDTTTPVSSNSSTVKIINNSAAFSETRTPQPITTPLRYVNRDQKAIKKIMDESGSLLGDTKKLPSRHEILAREKKNRSIVTTNSNDSQARINKFENWQEIKKESERKSIGLPVEKLIEIPSIKRKRRESEEIPNYTTNTKAQKTNLKDLRACYKIT